VKSLALTVMAVLLLTAVCPIAAAQGVVEYGLGAGRAATTAAPARDLGKQIGGMLDSLNKAANSGEGQAAPKAQSSSGARRRTTAASARTKTASHAPTGPAPVYEDPRHIEAGIGYEELVRRFGPPSMEVTTRPGRRTLSYAARENAVAVNLENEKVVSTAAAETRQSAVVLLH
jgi:hypothetical protein